MWTQDNGLVIKHGRWWYQVLDREDGDVIYRRIRQKDELGPQSDEDAHRPTDEEEEESCEK